VIGWSIATTPTAALVTGALGMAIESGKPAAGTLIHSDQGVQCTSWAFSQRAKASGLVPSMGGVGACYDNAMTWVVLVPHAGRAAGPATLADPR
jgi:putative transposase